jgi:hypothetical protein
MMNRSLYLGKKSLKIVKFFLISIKGVIWAIVIYSDLNQNQRLDLGQKAWILYT